MKQCVLLMLTVFLILSQANAANFQPVKDGPLHEAYVIQECGTILLETVPNPPPPDLTELIPNREDSQAIWIPGYWSWSAKHGQFLWVSGVWRRPPPNRHWVAGEWSKDIDGWVWLRGFWSNIDLQDMTYLSEPPPDSIDELVSSPPNHAHDYFWIPGYWQYDLETSRYIWFAGRWDILNPHWVYVPPQYVWREAGYLFISGFWDWPMDLRGLAFWSVRLDDEAPEGAVYEPVNGLPQLLVMETLFPYWPNYPCLFRYHYYFHHDAWVAWGVIPPWWNWPSWWCFTSQDQWWLWWWWTHPNYPNPKWINPALADAITPATDAMIKMMEGIKPPVNVTPNGVVGTKKIIDALATVSGKKIPIVPSDPKQIGQIQLVANSKIPKPPHLEPRGTVKVTQPPQKPFFGPQIHTLKAPPQRAVIPPKPIQLSLTTKQKKSMLASCCAQDICYLQIQPVCPQTYPVGMCPFENTNLPAPICPPCAPSYCPTYPPSYPRAYPGKSVQGQPPPAYSPVVGSPAVGMYGAEPSDDGPVDTFDEPAGMDVRPQPPQQYKPLPYFPVPVAPRTPAAPLTPQPNLQMRLQQTERAERAIPQPSGPQRNLPPPESLYYAPTPGTMESLQEGSYRRGPSSYPYQSPHQGYMTPLFRHPPIPMQTEHHDYLMSRPQPQINPEGPKAYQVPGDYSTLPNQ